MTFAAIANKTGISRSAISQLVNQGLRMKPEHEKKLWDAVNEIKGTEERLGPDVPVAPIHFKTRIELFETKEFKECMGWCNYVCSKRKMGVMVGHPGSGKTTVLRHFAQTQPGVLYIEAWPQMRVGDMLEAIARPLGVPARQQLPQDPGPDRLPVGPHGRADRGGRGRVSGKVGCGQVRGPAQGVGQHRHAGDPVRHGCAGGYADPRPRPPRQPGAALPPQGGIEAERASARPRRARSCGSTT